jgi:hypothetical protein
VEGHQGDAHALTDDVQDAVAVFLAQILHVGPGGLEDPQTQQSERRHQGEVVLDKRGSGGGEHGLELQVRQTQGRGLGRHRRTA